MKVGDKVLKYTGDYQWRGVVVSRFKTPDNKTRFVVAHKAGKGYVLHIYSEANLKKVSDR